VAGVLHLTSPAIAASSAYQRWAASLPGQQVLCGPEASPNRPGAGLGFHASARTLAKLHAISPQLFPLPAFCSLRGPSFNGADATQSSDPVTGMDAAAHEPMSPRNGRSVAVSGRPGNKGAEVHTARLLMSIDGSAGRPTSISDGACLANLDAGERCKCCACMSADACAHLTKGVDLQTWSRRLPTFMVSMTGLHAEAVRARLYADSPDLAAHVADIESSAPALAAARELPRPCGLERSTAWCREWHPHFPLPSPASDPPLLWRDAAGSWGVVRDSQQHPATLHSAVQVSNSSTIVQPTITQPAGQGAVPLHVVLPDGSVGVLAANIGDFGQQGSWQPVLMVPAAPVTALAGPASQQDLPGAQTRAAAMAAPNYQHGLLPGGDKAPRHTSGKRRHCLPDALGDSNQAAARSLRERLQKRNKPADGSAVVSNGEDQTAARISQPEAAAGSGLKSTSQLVSDDESARHRQTDEAAAVTISTPTAPAHKESSATVGAAVELGGGLGDAAVPECLWRMAAAGDDSEMVFLGTGCAEPSKYRGASGILLRCGRCDGTVICGTRSSVGAKSLHAACSEEHTSTRAESDGTIDTLAESLRDQGVDQPSDGPLMLGGPGVCSPAA